MNIYDIRFYKGDTFSFKVSLKDKTQNIDSAYLSVREYATEPIVLQKKLNQGITLVEEGVYRVQIESFDTYYLQAGVRYIFDLTFKCENVVKTILYGSFTLLPKLNEVGDTTFEMLVKEIEAKQDKLVSGVNIKTISNENIVGDGNLPIGTYDRGLIEPSQELFNEILNLLNTNYKVVLLEVNGLYDANSKLIDEGGTFRAYLGAEKYNGGESTIYIENARHIYKWTISGGECIYEEVTDFDKYYEVSLSESQDQTILGNEPPQLTLEQSQIDAILQNTDKNIVIKGYDVDWGYFHIYLEKKYKMIDSASALKLISYEGNFIDVSKQFIYIVYLVVNKWTNNVIVRFEKNAEYN